MISRLFEYLNIMALAVGIAVSFPSGSRMVLVDCYFHHSSFFFFYVTTFSYKTAARIKKLISRKLMKSPKTYGYTPFLTASTILGPSSGHFGFCRRFGVAGMGKF